ncbi:MAG: alpha-amylase family glycosyl hydrolase [Myxococcota bacterium]
MPDGVRRAAAWGVALLLVVVVGALAFRALTRPRAGGDDRDVLYFVMVDRFADGLPDPPGTVDRDDPQAWHGGDLPGLLAHVDDLAALGVRGLWLSPVSDAQTAPHGPWGAFHGYWVEDLRAVEPRFGTLDDLRALADALHARGMRLYLDLVYNHVGPRAPLVQEHPDWFHGLGDITDWDDPVQAVTHDVHGLPDLAQEDEAVYAYLRDASLWWIDQVHPDGFRVDAVRHLPAGFLARLGDELRAHAPGFELLGEVYDGNVDRVAARAAADRLDAVFDFPMYFAVREGLCGGGALGQIAALVGADYGGARPVTLVDNHDLPRIVSACGEDPGRAAMALAVVLTARGTPSLTWGTEVGLSGAEEPANRGDMVFGGAVPPIGATVRELVALRRAWPALRADETRVVGLSQRTLLMARIGDDEAVTVAVSDAGAEGDPPPRWVGAGAAREVEVVRGAGPLQGDGWGRGTVRLERLDAVPPRAERPVAALTLRLLDPPALAEGDRIVLVGPGQLLGSWDPEAGVRLDVDGAFHLPVRDGEVLQFKPVVVHADGSTTWEPHPDRFLLVTTDRWTGPGACGAWCAPIEDGAAAGSIRWADAAALHAVLGHDIEGLAEAIAGGADLRVRDEEGRDPLTLAVDLSDDAAVAVLLEAGTPRAADLLARAVREPNERLLALLLDDGAPVDAADAAGVTPLMVAVEADNVAAVARLVGMGADPDRRDQEGRSARDRAVGPWRWRSGSRGPDWHASWAALSGVTDRDRCPTGCPLR